jgi:phage shock protein PspC (stress-responsive transcriptional regulator)
MPLVATTNERPPVAGPRRGRQGRWLGGVCVGLAQSSRLAVGWIRLAFVVGALLGGVGLALYLACWLIMPAGGEGAEAPERSGVVVVARACAAAAGLALLGVLGGVAGVFGFGWEVLAVAAVILVAVLTGWRRAGPAWALLPVAALSLPALAFAAAGVRLTTQVTPSVAAPASAAAVSGRVYRSGLNTLLIDLRRTQLPVSGIVPMRVAAGMRRTIVALPANRCVRVVVHYDVNPFAVRLTALLTGRTRLLFSDVVAFGRLYGASSGVVTPPAARAGPVLAIDFRSQGGSLYVRDYPSWIDPDVDPDWPGYQVHVEPRPDVRGTPRRAAQRLIANWRARAAAELANARVVDALMPGPCAAPPHPGQAKPAAHPKHRARSQPRRRR